MLRRTELFPESIAINSLISDFYPNRVLSTQSKYLVRPRLAARESAAREVLYFRTMAQALVDAQHQRSFGGAKASTSNPKSMRLASVLDHLARLITRW